MWKVLLQGVHRQVAAWDAPEGLPHLQRGHGNPPAISLREESLQRADAYWMRKGRMCEI